MLQYLLVGRIAEGNTPKVIIIHELIEEVGTKHHGFRNLHGGILKLIQFGMTLDDVVKKSQSAPLAAQRAVANAGKVSITVEFQAVEDSHHANVLHVAVLHDGIEDNLTVGIQVLQLMPRHRLQELRHGEDGTGTEPTAHIVTGHMELERVGRNLEDIVLQLLQRRHPGHLLQRLRITEDKVAKAHVLLYQLAQVHVHLFRILVHEMETFRLGLLPVLNLRTLQNQRHVLIALSDFTQQLQTSLSVSLLNMCQTTIDALHREARVADDTQYVVRIHLIPVHGLLVGGGQHHLRTSALALGGSMWIQGLSRKVLRLRQDIVVKVWQHRRIEADVVLHQQYHLHARLLDIMFYVHLVLYQLDDGENQVGIAQPAEHIVEDGHVLILNTLGDAVRERRQHHAGNVG